MRELWYYDHYEQNGDNKRHNDHTRWSAYDEDGKQFLRCYDSNVEQSEAVEVTGDLEQARIKLLSETEKVENWPSLWLGPQCAADWDELCEALGLVRVGEPFPAD